MDNLPENVVNKILLFVSHPCADMIRDFFKQKEEEDDDAHCDACLELWDDCQCWCGHCWRTLPECRYTCYGFS